MRIILKPRLPLDGRQPTRRTSRAILAAPTALVASFLATPTVLAGDWPQWGRDNSRNMVSPEKNLPTSASPADVQPEGPEPASDPAKNVKWAVKLGSQSYGNPTVANGRVFVGTNNDSPRDPKHAGDRGVLMCFNEADGKFLWQLVVPKLAAGKVSDWEMIGLCSSPAVDGDHVYVVTNRCEVICLDINGLADGNAGPFTDEASYAAGPGNLPVTPGPADADIVWRFDMRDELGVFPHNMTSSSVLVVGDRVYATTSNSVDWTGHTPSPDSPALVCLDRNTGKLIAEERSGISGRLFNSNWSSPAYGLIGGKPMVVFGGGDGWCYGFDGEPMKTEGGSGTLRELWRFDCNPPAYRSSKDGKPLKYGHPSGPSEVIATPVVTDGRVVVAIGQDPEKGDGVGSLVCIDASLTGDITRSGKLWSFDDVSRSISTVSVVDGLIYLADFAGLLHCLDEKTGQPLWTHDTEGRVWGSTLAGDGRVYVGTENGNLFILAAGRVKKIIAEIDFGSPVYSTPVAANGCLFVATDKHLYAIGGNGPK